MLPAAQAAKSALGVGQQLSTKYLGYDFMGLVTKLVVFFGFALISDFFFKAAIGVDNIFVSFLGLLGYKVPQNTNSTLAKLFGSGWNGINFWTIIQFLAIAMVFYEAYSYYHSTDKQSRSIVTLGVFGMIIFLLSLTVIPGFLAKIKESGILKTPGVTS